MKKVILIYGSIAGIIVAAMFMITMPMYKTGMLDHDYGEIIGFSSMTIALSLIFFGVKSFRDNQSGGAIKFGKAMVIGLAIAGVASMFYAISWEITFNIFMPDFMDQYASAAIAKAKAKVSTEAEVQKVIEGMNRMREIYKNPVLRFAMTLMEIFPVGILIALISAMVLRKKEILPA